MGDNNGEPLADAFDDTGTAEPAACNASNGGNAPAANGDVNDNNAGDGGIGDGPVDGVLPPRLRRANASNAAPTPAVALVAGGAVADVEVDDALDDEDALAEAAIADDAAPAGDGAGAAAATASISRVN